MQLRTIKNIDVMGKYVLLRVDFNVQIVDGKITDAFRIKQTMPTIDLLKSAGAKIILCAHLGRPKGEKDEALSLKPIADFMKIPLIPDCLDKDFLSDMKNGDIVLLQNVRYYSGEEDNNPEFAKQLADGYDIFVNDGFAVSHRAHASTVGVATILPSYAGLLLADEVEKVSNVLENPKRPLTLIVGGSKVSTKLGLLKSFVKVADKIITGGAIGTTFSYAMGKSVGNSLYEANMKDQALEILKMANENNCEILLPIDKGVAPEFSRTAPRTDKHFDEILDSDVILDSGVETSVRNAQTIAESKTVIWNGSVGMAEWAPVWSYGSYEIAKAIASATKAGNITSVIGGGDTVAVFEALGLKDDVSYLSTGGGAFLELIEGKVLPGIAVLQEKN